jgi:hypothetical protein
MALNIMTLEAKLWNWEEKFYTVMLSIVVLSVVMFSIIMLGIIVWCVIMQSIGVPGAWTVKILRIRNLQILVCMTNPVEVTGNKKDTSLLRSLSIFH